MTGPLPTYGLLTRARVLRAGEIDQTWLVQAPSIAPELAFGPIPSTVSNLTEGDTVLLAQVGVSRGDQVIVGKIPPGELIIGIDSVTGLQTALDILDSDIDALAASTDTRDDTIEANVAANTAAIAGHTTAIAANTTAIATEHATNVSQDTALSLVALVRSEADLRAALTAGKTEIRVDGSVTIALAAQVDITYPVRIIGGRFSRTSGCAFHVTSSNVSFTNVSISGGAASIYDSTQKLIYVQGTSAAPLTGIAVRGCSFTGSRSDNVWLEWCLDSIVADCVITTFYYSGVMLISCLRVTVTGNVIRDSPLLSGQTVNNYGIAITDLDNTIAARSVNCTVVGNQVSLIDWEGIDTHGGRGLNITGNTITACPRGIALVTGNPTRLTSPQDITVCGNHVDGSGSRQTVREGIYVGGISGVPADAQVAGNTVLNFAAGSAFFADFVDRTKLNIGNNNVPFLDWTDIAAATGWSQHAIHPQYRIDGNTIYFRGGFTRTSTGVNPLMGTIAGTKSAFGLPDTLSFIGCVKGSSATGATAMLQFDTDGTIKHNYPSSTQLDTFFLFGSVQVV